jgi:hypothetical protein
MLTFILISSYLAIAAATAYIGGKMGYFQEESEGVMCLLFWPIFLSYGTIAVPALMLNKLAKIGRARGYAKSQSKAMIIASNEERKQEIAEAEAEIEEMLQIAVLKKE